HLTYTSLITLTPRTVIYPLSLHDALPISLELAGLLALDQAVRHQVAPAMADAGSACNPLDHLQIAHPARSLLQIGLERVGGVLIDRKSTRLNSSHVKISYAVFCLKKKKNK